MIRSFKDEEAERIFNRRVSKRLPQEIQKAARRKLVQLADAMSLDDLAIPGNRLEKLEGRRKGQWSVRINDQWRICFVWKDGEASEVEITDYH